MDEEPARRAQRLRADRLTGLIAAAVALAALWVANSLTPNLPFPPTALAERIIRITPGDVATFFIDLLGHWSMRLLTLGVLAGALVLGAEALPRSRSGAHTRPLLAGVVLAGVAAAASLSTPTFQPDPVLVLLAALVAAGIYAGVAKAAQRGLAVEEIPADESRRRVLRMGLGGALGLAALGGGAGWLVRRLGGPDRNVKLAAVDAPAKVPSRPAFPSVGGITPEITSPEDHYEVDVNLVPPSIDVSGWSLQVTGLVDRSMRFGFEDLQERFEVVEDYSVLSCVSNEIGGDLVGHSAWGGVRLADVLEAAGILPGAVDVVFRATDNYSDSIPVEVARDPQVILAVSQNGEPLTQGHGFPCRVRVPAIYGMKNVKWIESIEVVASDYQGYWQERGWSDDAVVKTSSRIDVAGLGGRASVGDQTWVAGVSWAGSRGISKVEVSVDGGQEWEEAELKEPIADSSWRLWAYRWTPEQGGATTVVCRATDGDGVPQTTRIASPHPDGSSGLHEVEVSIS